jgi:hypothetical protein
MVCLSGRGNRKGEKERKKDKDKDKDKGGAIYTQRK